MMFILKFAISPPLCYTPLVSIKITFKCFLVPCFKVPDSTFRHFLFLLPLSI